MNLPTFETYCDNTTAGNALRFDLGPITVWYSYKTPVAFALEGESPTVRRNEWGPTTGKHLNAIDSGDKSSRIDGDTFEALLDALPYVISWNPMSWSVASKSIKRKAAEVSK